MNSNGKTKIVLYSFLISDSNGALDFGWDSFSEETKLQKRAIELNQGRAAMMGLLGLMVHEKLGNVDILLPPGGN